MVKEMDLRVEFAGKPSAECSEFAIHMITSMSFCDANRATRMLDAIETVNVNAGTQCSSLLLRMALWRW